MGRPGPVSSRSPAPPTTYRTSATPCSTYYAPPIRGSSRPATSPAIARPSNAPLAVQAQLNFARLRISGDAPPREPVKKALLVGFVPCGVHDV